jgi:3-oxoacyl-[acyl-carrier-protein] synthase-1
VVYKIADNITSLLGTTTEQNYQAVKAGRAALREDARLGLPPEGALTRFETLVVRSVRETLKDTTFDVSSDRVVFVLSTTKANVELLGQTDVAPAVLYPGESARRIAAYLGFTMMPVVVCNACISGVSALILASRMLEMGMYDYAVVCGADVLNPFVLSGFDALKALSPEDCRPFDIDRNGMNLGEAAATIVLSTEVPDDAAPWVIGAGAVRNDAYHISTPSNKAEGATMALQAVMNAVGASSGQELALVNAHGTGTMFMDQMESVAIVKSGLGDIPVNSYKGYYGHTLGAAGVLETVLTMRAFDDQTIVGTRGFEELGVSGQLKLSAENQPTDKTAFVKIISGFGGGNAVVYWRKMEGGRWKENTPASFHLSPSHRVTITPESVTVDGKSLACEGRGKALLTALYKQYASDYPKFYKMDMLCRLGFIAAELLNGAESQCQKDGVGGQYQDNRAMILFNHSSSIHADRAYLASISDADNYFPSPSLFVYTLPNIVAGELATRHHYHGETSFYILPERDERLMWQIQTATFADPAIDSMISGWLDCEDEDHFLADLYLLSKPF